VEPNPSPQKPHLPQEEQKAPKQEITPEISAPNTIIRTRLDPKPSQNQTIQKIHDIAIQPPKPKALKSHINPEQLKIDTENEILKKKIPINVLPYMASSLQPTYANPFFISQTAPSAQTLHQLPQPHHTNLSEFSLSSSSESSLHTDIQTQHDSAYNMLSAGIGMPSQT
jgi:hypothetical protein